MIGIPLFDDRNTYVPDWFVNFYDEGYYWIIIALMVAIISILIGIIGWQSFELRELERFLNIRNKHRKDSFKRENRNKVKHFKKKRVWQS